jgi:hypothetical protein
MKEYKEKAWVELERKGLEIPKEVSTTSHTREAYITNNWGITLPEVTLRHRRSNDASKQEQTTWDLLVPGERVSSPLSFTYETGPFSPYDYWWIKFSTLGGDTYTCKDNFYCSVSASDDGKVEISLEGKCVTKQMSMFVH